MKIKQAWESYKANELPQLVDSVLETNFSEDEAVRFIKVALLCVQENARLRPRMSSVIKMLKNEVDIGETEILQPSLITDLMAIKMEQDNSSQNHSVFSKGSTTTSSQSPFTSYF